jgi:hypothetical protein
MILIYPEKYKENCPNFDNIQFLEKTNIHYDQISSGLYDTMILKVEHLDDVSDFNYSSQYNRKSNIHYVWTFIDCRYKSKNLELLIDKFKQIEEIWNS